MLTRPNPRDRVDMLAPEGSRKTLPEWLRPAAGRVPDRGGFLIGAAIGVGMVARAAELGGADFLLALAVGRLRIQGAPSIASMLPTHDANACVEKFGRAEILGKVTLPVMFGVSVFDPRTDIDQLLDRIKAWGFAGITNFPTSIHLDARFAVALARHGLGYGREIDLVRKARERGLGTVAYARSDEQATGMAEAGADMLCLNFGWNAGGQAGLPSALGLDDAGKQAARIFTTLRRKRPGLLCVVEGGPIESPESAADVCRASGADGYIGGSTLDRMPLETAVVEATSAYRSVAVLNRRIEALQDAMLGDGRRFGLIGRSPGIRHVVRLIERFAPTAMSVLILGPNGSGKELVARALHATSHRAAGPLVTLNCAALPRDLVESELFGHAKGAFTGATLARLGRFEEAEGGSLFLDEIGELDFTSQAKLLRVLEDGTFERLGSNQTRRADARIICATNCDLREMVAAGRFREDLFYRLNKLEIMLPPLSERLEDVPALVEHILQTAVVSLNPQVRSVDGAALRALIAHSWPGNVRELRNVLERAAVLCDTDRIGVAHLPSFVASTPSFIALTEPPQTEKGEREWLLDMLQRHRFHRTETAQALGMARKTLYNKMRRYCLL
jgi:two-component system response regulator AtoC